MSHAMRNHLTTFVAVTIAGIVTCCIGLSLVLNNVGSMSVSSFNAYIIVIPCAVMLAASLLIMLTASEIDRQMYLVVIVVCLATGLVSMVVTSAWMSDQAIAEQLLANSPEGTTVIPVMNNVVTMIRDVAAFVVVPTVGCIAGVWIGSRLHTVKSSGGRKKRK